MNHPNRPNAQFDIVGAYENPEYAARLDPDVAHDVLVAMNAIQDLVSRAYNYGVTVGKEIGSEQVRQIVLDRSFMTTP